MADELKKENVENYEIKIKGHLDARWSDWFYDMAIIHDPEGNTILCGPLPDQTVLHSVLDRLRDMNLPLISVNPAPTGGQEAQSSDVKEIKTMYDDNPNSERRNRP
jgi:hypothetical protein